MPVVWPLHALALALALGEGCAWAALGAVGVVCATSPQTGDAHHGAGRPLMGAAWGLILFLAAGAWAVWAGPYGLLRPSALGHWLPIVAWPVVARAAARASAKQRATTAALFVTGLAVAASVNLLAAGSHLVALQHMLRPTSLDGGQIARPGATTLAVGGLYFHRLKMAHVLLVALSLPVAALLTLGPRAGRLRALLPWLASGLLTMALALTFARAAYLGAAWGFVTVFGAALGQRKARARRLVPVLLLALAAVTGALVLSPAVRARLTSASKGEAANVRGVIWQQASAIICQHPWGIGLSNYPSVVARYYAVNDPLTPSPKTYPHSLILMAWAEGGPLGAIGFALFWGELCVVGVRAMAARGRARCAGAALLFLASALFVVGLTHDVLFHNVVALSFFAALGLVSAELAAGDDAR